LDILNRTNIIQLLCRQDLLYYV